MHFSLFYLNLFKLCRSNAANNHAKLYTVDIARLLIRSEMLQHFYFHYFQHFENVR